jgi:hypothetical protein
MDAGILLHTCAVGIDLAKVAVTHSEVSRVLPPQDQALRGVSRYGGLGATEIRLWKICIVFVAIGNSKLGKNRSRSISSRRRWE